MRTLRGLHAGLEAPRSARLHCSVKPLFEQSLSVRVGPHAPARS
jgi:hypothetical protein